MSIWVWIIIACLLGAAITLTLKYHAQAQAEYETFVGNHRGWDFYISPHGRGVIAIEHDRQLLALGTIANSIQFPWSDIAAAEIEKNGQSITSTNRGSQAMGAAVGAALLGPVGLLLGGLSGSKRNREQINELALKIVVDDRRAPLHRVVFFRQGGNGVSPKSRLLKEPAERLEHFHALVGNAIRASQRFPAITQTNTNVEAALSQLWELRQAGALTQEEFSARKAQLLNAQDTTDRLQAE